MAAWGVPTTMCSNSPVEAEKAFLVRSHLVNVHMVVSGFHVTPDAVQVILRVRSTDNSAATCSSLTLAAAYSQKEPAGQQTGSRSGGLRDDSRVDTHD